MTCSQGSCTFWHISWKIPAHWPNADSSLWKHNGIHPSVTVKLHKKKKALVCQVSSEYLDRFTRNYFENEEYFLSSPSFSLSSLQKPNITIISLLYNTLKHHPHSFQWVSSLSYLDRDMLSILLHLVFTLWWFCPSASKSPTAPWLWQRWYMRCSRIMFDINSHVR